MKYSLFGIIFLLLVTVGYAANGNISSDEITPKFNLYYAAWMKDCERWEIQVSSHTKTRTDLPSFKKIISLGRPALPLIKEKMKSNFIMAYAAIEILGWKRSDFKTSSEQEFRDRVLERMRVEKIAE
jgi:hypothetical protein